ncbi:response regulator [Paenibacillus humicola]|uniref:response regulator n=1 Tax=Paenibacillus humicola TaxID=3110540 RepID=UPI00237C50C1|nr:response regulator [Paenibacillus humicola]
MYNLLIVDDEAYIVEGLADLFAASDLPLGHVATAGSAKSALELCAKMPIDIVVTDIRMPGMTGLDLLDNLYKLWKRVKVIFLTGYADFDYAKRALQSRAFDYLLKPVEDEDLLICVRKAIALVEEELEQALALELLKGMAREEIGGAQTAFFNELLNHGAPAEPQELGRLLAGFNLPFCPDGLVDTVMLRIDDWDARFKEEDLALIHFAAGNLFAEMVGGDAGIASFRSGDAYTAFVIASGEAGPGAEKQSSEVKSLQWEKTLREAQNTILRVLGAHVSFALSERLAWSQWPAGFHYLAARMQQMPSPETVFTVRASPESWWTPADQDRDGERMPDVTFRNGERIADVASAGADPMHAPPAGENNVVSRVQAYITDHLNHDLSLDSLARKFYLNPSYLSRIFHRQTGEPLSRYIERSKMECAKKRLADPKLKVYEVAELAGYRNPNYFAKVFRKMYGISPQQYRMSFDFGAPDRD